MDLINKILVGDSLNILKSLPDKLVDCVVTSPPYWALRNYKTKPIIWGDDKDCQHEWEFEQQKHIFFPTNDKFGGKYKTIPQVEEISTGFCVKCGAWLGELGLEPDFNLYINHLCDVFDQVKRVLKDSGTCWVNIGDTYGGSSRGKYDKSLLLIPFRFALEMVKRGWTLRNVIIWQKPNCTPSSAKDRFTVDFEYLFFFSKSKKYYFEQQIEPFKDSTIKRCKGGCNENKGTFYQGLSKENFEKIQEKILNGKLAGKNKRAVWSIATSNFKEAHFAVYPPKLIETPIKAGCPEKGIVLDPFMGSGTTGVVAKQYNRNWLGIELNPEYAKMAEARINAT
ncbi:MAG TPA: site-specific DNA-methyltransferase [Candidatus Gastranaerophilales bacterium]|nr:site-specific DNA-methyltransferase [Candidatus Gastranaerophilales bacterium]